MNVGIFICSYKGKNYRKEKNNNENKTLYFLEYKAFVGMCDSSRAADLKLSVGNDI